ncbi:MAG: acyltransferase [Saccharofermentans sp.]|nr:acyltransferase [Saccharofermentans sp.]
MNKGKMNTKSERQQSVELIRFLLSVVVCLHHLMDMDKYVFRSGYLSVDVFFVLSGFFLMKQFISDNQDINTEKSTLLYVKSRIKRLFPHHLFSWIITAFVMVFVTKAYTVNELVYYGWPELFLLKATGIGNNITINGVAWYISALVICSFIIYWILLRIRKSGDPEARHFSLFYAPICFLVIMAYIWSTQEKLNYWTQSSFIFTGGFLRGMAGMSIGCTAYAFVQVIRKRIGENPNRRIRIFASIYELIGWFIVFAIMFTRGGLKDFIIPVLSTTLIISMFSAKSYLSCALNNKVCGFLGRISYPMYLNQSIFIRPLRAFCAGAPLVIVAPLMLLGLFVFSVVSDWFVNLVTKKIESRLT